MTIRDLLAMGLTPQQFMAACFILDRAEGSLAVARTADVAEAVGLAPRQARRLVAGLIERGVLARIERGVYRVGHEVLAEAQGLEDPVEAHEDPERSSMTAFTPVSSHMTNDMATKTPNGVLVGRSAPLKGYKILKGFGMRREDHGDDLGGVGRTGQPPPSKPPSTPPQFHRVVPREDWNMNFVAKEFRHRLHPHRVRLNLVNGGGDNRLPMALRKWQADHGLTPVQAATLVDDFFDDAVETARLGNGVDAWRHFLDYAKRNLDRVQARSVSADEVERIQSQVLPW